MRQRTDATSQPRPIPNSFGSALVERFWVAEHSPMQKSLTSGRVVSAACHFR